MVHSPSLGGRPACPPLPNLRDPAAYPDFFGQKLEYAVFLHKSMRRQAPGSGISTKSKDWEWICEQITMDGSRPEWIRRTLNGQLGVLFAGLFVKLATAGYLYASAPLRLPECSLVGIPFPTPASRKMAGPSPRATRPWRSILKLSPDMFAAYVCAWPLGNSAATWDQNPFRAVARGTL